MTKKFMTIIVLFMCAGCATSNFGNVSFNDAPKGTPSADTAVIYVMREGVKPTMLNPRILVNNTDVGKLPNNSFIWIQATVGKVFVETKWGWDAGTNNSTYALNAEPNKIYYLILRHVGDKCVYPYYNRTYNEFFELEEDIAVHTMEKLKYYENK